MTDYKKSTEQIFSPNLQRCSKDNYKIWGQWGCITKIISICKQISITKIKNSQRVRRVVTADRQENSFDHTRYSLKKMSFIN